MADDSDYVLEPLYQGARSILYRGTERASQRRILAVAHTVEQPSRQSLRLLEHELSLAPELDPAWAATPLGLARHEGREILVLRDPGGEPLDRLMVHAGRQALDLTRLLRIAINLTSALGRVHRRGLIHKDVKPANVLVDARGRTWLTGFGFASRLASERPAASRETMAGTLAYMSPEQTGRMNRSIDARSDLYSLGVTLYQMLTGTLPFDVSSPLQWVHCHIALRPVAPADRCGLPEPLSAIIMRLLAKDPEERYQTAAGLKVDLRRCLSEWQSQGRMDPFPLGSADLSDRLLIPGKLYGRESEVAALLAACDRVVGSGDAEWVLVAGYSGVGKTSVVNELHKALVPPRGLFAAGKFDQHQRDVPYATLAQAFQKLVREILVEREAEVAHWRRLLLDALGPNGQLIIDLVPEVEFIIGKQPAVADLPPQEARIRFQWTFRRFLGAFARQEHPLALFLDDLQWLDGATLELLERMATDPDLRNVLLIAAYRDNEVGPSHPLTNTLAAIRAAGARVHEIVLSSLSPDDVGRIMAGALHCDRHSLAPLACLVHEKTGGNPFFVTQFFTSLDEDGSLRFDQEAAAWTWDLDQIRRKHHSRNVVDFMLEKLRRLPQPTQAALQRLALFGAAATIRLLTLASERSEDEIVAALWDAVRTGLILRAESAYAFAHDRIQAAAYTLIPEETRASMHLGIGIALLARLDADDLSEHLFDVANQLNRGSARLVEQQDKVRAAWINLRAGRRAKASAAFESAREYFAAGVALLDGAGTGSPYELTFNLALECAECERTCGNFENAERLIAGLLPHAATRIDLASVYASKISLHFAKAENQHAVDSALTCLRQFGIDLSAHPTEEEFQSEREALARTLQGRSIESLVDLPLMTDPELLASMKVLGQLLNASHSTDFRLCCVQVCRMVMLSVEHGTCGASGAAFAFWGSLLRSVFQCSGDGYRFAKLACDVVDKHGFAADRPLVYISIGVVAPWTQPIGLSIDFMRTGIDAAMETGMPLIACIGMANICLTILLRNDPLDAAWRESEAALDFARAGVKNPDWTNAIICQRRFIAAMQGRTASLSDFGDAQFDEVAFEAGLDATRMPPLVAWYWILKLQARFLSGDHAEALEAAGKANPAVAQFMMSDYFYYAALAAAALHETGSADEKQAWRELLNSHGERLREWADMNPPTFAGRYALVCAEIARLENRDADALTMYERAIRAAREQGFVQNEAVAHELAARYCLALGLETAGYAHLHNARDCYARWGAPAKVLQLEGLHPRLRATEVLAAASTMGPPIAQLDVEGVLKASQALSSEMVLPRLIEKLVRIAVELAGAGRGLLILFRGGDPWIEAEAVTASGTLEVMIRPTVVAPDDLLQSALSYVIRTQEGVLLDDASIDNVYSRDAYVRLNQSRSILCLPIINQSKLAGALYLENDLAPFVFTPGRAAVLRVLASQAAISLQNANLFSDLQLHAGLLQMIPVSAWTLEPDGTPDFVNHVWLDYAGQTLDFVRSHPEAWMTAIHPDDREAASRVFRNAIRLGREFAIQTRSLRARDKSYRWHIQQAVVLRDAEGKVRKFVGTTTDIDDQKRAEEALYQARDDLSRIHRATTMGELAASLAHEIIQPITGAMTNANACLRILGADEPDLELTRGVVTRISRDAQRAADIIDRIRSQFRKDSSGQEALDLAKVVGEVIVLLRGQARRCDISIRTDFVDALPLIIGDRVQLHQVAMNLIVNSIEAMKDVDGKREIVIKSQRDEDGQVRVSISDTGTGFPPELAEQLFAPFFTTKPQGTGMGLRICRSIIESHGGRLWAEGGAGRGAVFHLSLPAA